LKLERLRFRDDVEVMTVVDETKWRASQLDEAGLQGYG
jgi:hypothetical protein